MFSFITKKDALIEEKDALIEEKDALIEEKDALIEKMTFDLSFLRGLADSLHEQIDDYRDSLLHEADRNKKLVNENDRLSKERRILAEENNALKVALDVELRINKHEEYKILSDAYLQRIEKLKSEILELKIKNQDLMKKRKVRSIKKGNVPHQLRDSRNTRPYKKSVIKRDGRKCRYCGKDLSIGSGNKIVLDHVYPHAMGGKTIDGNLVVSCQSCNSKKSDSIGNYWPFPIGHFD